MNKDKNSIVSPRGVPPVVDTPALSQHQINPMPENQQQYFPQYGYQYVQPQYVQQLPQYVHDYTQQLPQYVHDYTQQLPQYVHDYTQQLPQYVPQLPQYVPQLPQYVPQLPQYVPQLPQYVPQLPYYVFNYKYVADTTVDKNSSQQEQLM